MSEANQLSPFGIDLLRQKRRATKFHAESTTYHAEINFLDLFREENVFLGFCLNLSGSQENPKRAPWQLLVTPGQLLAPKKNSRESYG